MNTLFPFLVVLAMLWGAEFHTVSTSVQCKSGKRLRQDCRTSIMKYRVTVIKELWWCRRGNINCGYREALDLDSLKRDIAKKKACCDHFSWFHKLEICILESIENLEICRNGSTTTTTKASTTTSATTTTTSTPTTSPTTSATTTTTPTTTTSPTTSATITTTSTTTTSPTTSATITTTSTTTTSPTTSATITTTSTTTTSPTTSTTTTTTSTTTTSPTTSATTTTTSTTTTSPTTSTTTTTTSSTTTSAATLPLCRAVGGSCLFSTPQQCLGVGGRVDSGLFCPDSPVCCVF